MQQLIARDCIVGRLKSLFLKTVCLRSNSLKESITKRPKTVRKLN